MVPLEQRHEGLLRLWARNDHRYEMEMPVVLDKNRQDRVDVVRQSEFSFFFLDVVSFLLVRTYLEWKWWLKKK